MKILQINSVANKGSTGRIAENIGLSIMKEGWSSYIAYGRGDENQSKSHTYRIGSTYSNIIHALGTRLTDRHGFFSKKETNKLIEKIEKIQPDLIHLHNIHGYYLNIEVLFNYLSKVNTPVVWTLHDCWAFTGHCAYFDFVNCSKWKTSCFDCPNVQAYPKSCFIDNSSINYKKKKKLFNSVSNITFVPVSNWLNALLSDSFLSKYSSIVIHNGIDLTTFINKNTTSNLIEKYKIDMQKPIILGVANVWDQRKGLRDFVQLSKYVHDSHQIILVGLSSKQIKQLPDEVIGVERTESIEQLAQFYSLATVFVNPTYEDNFPTTNLEALACGTPVITYNTGGSPEAIDDETGYVVEKGDIGGLIEKIELISKKGKRFYQSKCRERAERLYNKDDRDQDYIALYKELLNKKNDTIQR